MTFLPIVQRELRVASRRQSTYRIRSWTAVTAIGVSFISLLFFLLTGRARADIGNLLFANLTSCAFGLCLLAGVFLTADALSEEKREGTLGLLFLTELNGYDIVLGKFAAMLLRALYGLLALLPIIAISLLLGGVTGKELWFRALALMNGLFVSLAAGIWISALVRDSQMAVGGAIGLMFLLAVALPAASPIIRVFGWLSPIYPFSYSSAALYLVDRQRFWGALTVSHGLGWLFLGMASWTLPRRWQEGGLEVRLGALLERLAQWRGAPGKRLKGRRELLSINPILWLVSRTSGLSRLAWLIVITWVGLVGLLFILSPRDVGSFVDSRYGMPLFGFLLKAIFTIQVCQFFSDGRRSGALEMLLSTPLTNREIILGQSGAMRRAFLWPCAVFAGVLFVPVTFQVMSGVHALKLDQLIAGTGGFAMCLFQTARMGADLLALFWLGLWLALTMKKPSFAPALTLVAVIILPAFLCWFDILADLGVILWCSMRLRQDLRWLLARQHQRVSAPAISAIGRSSVAIPPVICAQVGDLRLTPK